MRRAFVIFLGLLALAPACAETEDGGCLSALLPEDCTPQYEPSFEKVFTQTLQPGCAVGGGSCHSSVGAQGGLVFEDIDEAYTLLTASQQGDPLVSPGDPACSKLMIILEEENPQEVMPPGNPLNEGERCAIMKWIENGAQR